MSAKRFLVGFGVSVTLFYASAVVVVAAKNDTTSGPSRPPAVQTNYSHQQLQSDAWMTQGMSSPQASTMPNDAQRQRSSDPAYVVALEQHQEQIDRMLAR